MNDLNTELATPAAIAAHQRDTDGLCRRPSCPRHTAEQTYCPEHFRRVRRNLHDLADAIRDLASNTQLRPTNDRVGSAILDVIGPVPRSAGREAHRHQLMSALMGRIPYMADVHGTDVGDDSPLWTLADWDTEWRRVRDEPTGLAPTLARLVAYLDDRLDWANDTRDRGLDELNRQLVRHRARIDNLLGTGARTVYGIPCLHCGTSLKRWYEPLHVVDGRPVGGLRDDWWCDNCELDYTPAQYEHAKLLAAEIARIHVDEHDVEWAPISVAAARIGARTGTIRQWIARGLLGSLCPTNPTLRGETYVRLDEVQKRHRRGVTTRPA